MSDPIVVFDHVYKKFSRSEHVGTLRDLVPLLLSRATRGWRGRSSDAPPELGGQEFWAVHDVSFQLRRGETLGIIGPNGSGKSTTLKLLSRILRPDRGSYQVNGRLSALIEVGAGFHPDLTGRENIFLNCAILGMPRAEVRARFDEIVDFAGVREFIDAPVKYYSSGMAVRLGFATSVFTRPDVLLVDEVLAVGDMEFRSKCERRMQEMRRAGVSIILVSHNLGEVRSLCDRALMLFNGRTEMEGPTPVVVEKYHQVISEKIAAGNGHARGVASTPGAAELPLEITRVELLDAQGRPSERFGTGEAATFRAHYRARRRVERPHVRFEVFWTVGEVRCCGFDSEAERVDVAPIEEGAGHVDLQIDQMLMAPDAYLVTAHLGGEGVPTAVVHKVPFRVTQVTPIISFFGLPHSWRAVQGPSDANAEGGAAAVTEPTDFSPNRLPIA
jgi:ABC-type polysaccharide/polyol phosphate transport system ATPase subunit